MTSFIKNPFLRRKIAWTIISALLWSVILQTVYFCTFVFIVNFNLFDIVSWIRTSFSMIFSFKTLVHLVAVSVILFAHCVIFCEDIIFGQKYCATRFCWARNFLSVRNLWILVLLSLTGGFITWMYLLPLEQYSDLTLPCQVNPGYCLNEGTFLLVLNGCWIGVYFFVTDYLLSSSYQLFPVVQQMKYPQIKTELIPALKRTMVTAVSPSVYFTVWYFWKGGSLRVQLTDAVGISLEQPPLDSVSGLLSKLFIYMWLFSTMFMLTIHTVKLLLNIYLHEHTLFSISSNITDPNVTTLQQGLAETDFLLIRQLAFLDLRILAEKDHKRREELFALSQPGGHPHSWNAVLSECLKLIRNFTEELNRSISELVQVPETSFGQRETAPATPGQMPLHVHHPHHVHLPTEATSPRSTTLRNLRNVSMPPQVERLACESTTVEEFKSGIKQAINKLCKKPGFYFLFGELPERRIKFLLSQGQPIIWAVDSLSIIAAASLTEDQYGVVQKDLPAIIMALLQLKLTIEKSQKTNTKKLTKKGQLDAQMKTAVRQASKRALYRICIPFKCYLENLPLTYDVLNQLQMFATFREA